jgi:plastocyanin domain-containing protein
VPKYGISKTLVPGDNLIEFTPTEDGNIPYTCSMGMISSNIKVVSDVSKASGSSVVAANNSSSPVSTSPVSTGSSCCGVTPPGFVGGKIPTNNIELAKVKGNTQEVTVTVNNLGYSPAVLVLQKGVQAKIKFNTEQLSSCNSTVVFPEYQGQLDLNSQKETPYLTPTQDFTFQCGMGMLHGYVKVVDDINKVDLAAIKKEVQNYKPAGGGGGGCCGQ